MPTIDVTQAGFYAQQLSPGAIRQLYRRGVVSPALDLAPRADFEEYPVDDVLVLGRGGPYESPKYATGHLYRLWIFGSETDLRRNLHRVLRQYMPAQSEPLDADEVWHNDERIAVARGRWAHYSFTEDSGDFESTGRIYPPQYLANDGVAANIGAYQQTMPELFGLAAVRWLFTPGGLIRSYAVTIADDSTITVPMPSSDALFQTGWAVELAVKWDTGSAHTVGHIFSQAVDTSGHVRLFADSTGLTLELEDSGAATVSITAPADVANVLDGQWHAIRCYVSPPNGSGLQDAELYVDSHRYAASEADLIDVSDYSACDAAALVFGAGAVVPSGEEWEGDIAHLSLGFGSAAELAAFTW